MTVAAGASVSGKEGRVQGTGCTGSTRPLEPVEGDVMTSHASVAGSFSKTFLPAKIRRGIAEAWRGTLAVGLAVLLVPLSEADLLAQQAPPPPDPQGYGQSQNYGQQPYNAQPQQAPYGEQPQQAPYGEPQAAPNGPQYPDEGEPYPEQGYGQQQEYSDQGQGYPENVQQQALAPEQLEQLVAPIALYPDALMAQVLAASTYPLQISAADRWRQAQGDVSPDQIAAGANAQDWDPSVKALTAFPQVLDQMAENLQWTTNLGNAYYNQPEGVLAAVQTMRQRAQSAGNLQSTPQETVTDNQGYVEVAPANPQIVYVPAYDPWTVYGQPIAPYPGFSLLDAIGTVVGAAFAVHFGVGLVMTAFAGMPWGWLGWGCSWRSHALLFHGAGYWSHSGTVRDWGLPRGGPRAYGGRFDVARGGAGFGRGYAGRPGGYSGGSYGNRGYGYAGNRGAEGYRGNAYAGGRSPQQAYNRMPAFNARGGNEIRPASGYGVNGRMGSNYGAARPGYGGFNGRSGNYASGLYGRGVQSYNGAGAMGRGYGMAGRQPQYGNTYRGSMQGSGGFGQSYRGSIQPYRGSIESYRASAEPYRAPAFSQHSYSGRSSGSFGGYSGYSGHSSGSHFFGGGSSSRGFSGGGHYSGGGGHFGGGGGHFGGGGHSGGGGHFGGGHSGGGGHHH